MRTPTALAMLAAALTVNSALAEDFVYQGSLSDNTQPADGLYDLTFEYYTAIAGGPALQTATRQDVLVTDGVFQVTLPMPPSDNARFLELAVRDGASTGGYTQLLPRTFIASTPYATKALNVEWELNTSNFLTFGDGDDIVLINRDNRIGSEYFGVGADTGGFGGMYVSTSGASGFPFYGYNAGAAFESFAFHYFNGATGDLLYNVGGSDNFVMRSDGDFEVAGTALAADFNYRTPQTRSYSLPPAAFRPADMSNGFIPYVAGSSAGEAYIAEFSSLASLVAPVSLPDGATVTRLSVSLEDISTGRLLQAQLRRTDQNGNSTVIDSVGTTAPEIFTGVKTKAITGAAAQVDNDFYGYEITIAVNNLGWTNVLGTQAVRWVELEYTVNQPD